MGLLQKIAGSSSNNVAEVDSNHQLLVGLPSDDAKAGKVIAMQQNDDGTYTGESYLASVESDDDYRQRVGGDVILFEELFNYTAQNTNKITTYAAPTNFAPTWATGGFNTNPTGVLTASSAVSFATYAMFSQPSSGTLYVDMELAFNAQPIANNVFEFGLFQGGAATPFAPTDGFYFQHTSAGIQGVANYGGTPAYTGYFRDSTGQAGTYFLPTLNTKYQFIITVSNREAEFWVSVGEDTFLLGSIPVPLGQGTLAMAQSWPAHVVQRATGGAIGGAISVCVSRIAVGCGGVFSSPEPGAHCSRAIAAYEALPGSGSFVGLQGNAISSGITTAPTAAALTNTTNASGIAGLGGYTWETFSTALNIDGIILSYQVPAATLAAPGRRLRINGVSVSAAVQTVLAGGPQTRLFYLAFGGTTVSLQATESNFVKLARRIRLPFVQNITTNQAVNTMISQNLYDYKFVNPVYVNPGEWVQVVEHAFGTVGTTGTVAHVIAFDYTWE